ncbi:UBP1-associated protein 2B [Cocos nucifera]|nr:UBP1-associated protein 2B [Cocos nucifera]
MATKKRKVDQEDDLLSAPNNDSDPQSQILASTTAAPPVEEDEADDEDEDVGNLLEPLTKEQLISLLRSAAASDPATLAEIHRLADLDPAHRKLFVHGLGWETTSDGLRAAFASYGEIEDCRVVADKATGRSKGYGFLLFRHRRSARQALRQPQKLIDNRMTACQLASTGPPSAASHPPPPHHHTASFNPNPNATPQDNLPRKIYVGNVHSNIDGARLHAFFSKYGEIEEGPIGFDRQTGKPKGFALFVYKNVDGARRALEEPNKNFDGYLLYCQKATDSKAKATSGAAAAAAAPPSNAATTPDAPSSMGGANGSGYGGTLPDMGLAQQAAILGQGLLGLGGTQAFGQGMQPNAAVLAMLAAAGQNPASFGINPAVLASLNPALASALGAGGQQAVPPSAASQTMPSQNYGMGNMG